MADPAVDDLAVELDALRLELGASSCDIRNADRNPRLARRERLADTHRVEDVERDLAERELDVVLALGLDRQPERLGVELLRSRNVLRQDGDEVDGLDLHQGSRPSEYRA